MERLHRTVVQLEEAKRFIINGDVPHLALALILLDNAAEVMMRRIVEDELEYADMYARMLTKLPTTPLDAKGEKLRNEIASRVVPPKRQEWIRRNFPEKAKFLSAEHDRIPLPIARALEHLHTYRNETQHQDRVRPESIRPAVLLLFDICADLILRLEPGSGVWESDGGYTWLRKYGFDNGPFFGIGADNLRERIAADLRAELPLANDGVRTALVTHLYDRLDGVDDQISNIQGLSSVGPDRALALKAVQFWKQVGGIVDPNDAKLQAFIPPYDLDSLRRWREAASGLNSIEDKMELFDGFAKIEDEFEPLEAILDYVVSAIETAGEIASDISRGA